MIPKELKLRIYLAMSALLLFTSGCPLFDAALEKRPLFVYLTWQGDTSQTMTVVFHTKVKPPSSEPYVEYTELDAEGNPIADSARVAGESARPEAHEDGHWVHHVELENLTPGGSYSFFAGLSLGVSSAQRKFRTIPDSGEPIKFVNGGDVDSTDEAMDLMRLAADQEPMFVLLGGDLVYESRSPFGDEFYEKWDDWLQLWDENMVTPTGYTVPMVSAIGDHESLSDNGYGSTREEIPFFLDYIPQNGELTYFSRTFGPNLIIYVLDSAHLYTHGEQETWLRNEMAIHSDYPNQFAAYHAPLYPSYRAFDDIDENPFAVMGRTIWGPIFDEFNLDTAFEHDEHTLKRSSLIRGGMQDDTGTLYLGDGAMGRATRKPDNSRWFLAFSEEVNHFWLVSVSNSETSYTAIGDDGLIYDSYVDTRSAITSR